MEEIELKVLIAGGLVPFIISVAKRYSPQISKSQISFVTMLVSFAIASVFELFENNFNWREFLSRIVTVYGTSQIIYWAVLKTLELDERIESK